MGPLIDTLGLGLRVRVSSDVFLDVIAEIGNEAHAVVQLDVQRLVVNRRPLSIYHFLVALTVLAAFAEHCLGFVTLDEVDSVNVFAGELELVGLVYHLDLVWH